MPAILIAGCGDVGSELARRLLADGHDVYGLRRRVQLLPEGVRPVAGDLRDPHSLRTLPREIDVLCYTASADRRSPEAYRDAYVDGLRNAMLAIARKSALRRVLYVSSTRVYPQNDGERVDENSPTEGDDVYARLLLEGERVARESTSSAVVVRFGGIYGPGRTRLIDLVRKGGSCAATHCTNRIHRDDCAGALRHLMQLERALPVYVGTDHEPATQCEVMDWIAERLRLPPPARRDGHQATTGKRCDNTRLVASGYAFEYPSFREGYGAVIAGLSTPGGSSPGCAGASRR